MVFIFLVLGVFPKYFFLISFLGVNSLIKSSMLHSLFITSLQCFKMRKWFNLLQLIVLLMPDLIKLLSLKLLLRNAVAARCTIAKQSNLAAFEQNNSQSCSLSAIALKNFTMPWNNAIFLAVFAIQVDACKFAFQI